MGQGERIHLILANCGNRGPLADREHRSGWTPWSPRRSRRADLPFGARTRAVSASGENRRVDLARFGWIATVFACLVAVLILLVQGYYGYALVTFAVAVSAAFNLT
jgi:hypothetical protein